MTESNSDGLYDGPTIQDIYAFRRRVGMTSEDVCDLLHISHGAYRRGSSIRLNAADIATLEKIDEALMLIATLKGNDQDAAKSWFKTENVAFSGVSPFRKLISGSPVEEVVGILSPTKAAATPSASSIRIEEKAQVRVVEAQSTVPDGVDPAERIWRLKDQIKHRCMALDPSISLAELGRRIQKNGAPTFHEGTPSRWELGRSDASWNEIQIAAKLLGVNPYELIGRTPPEIRPLEETVSTPSIPADPLEAPSGLPDKGGNSLLYQKRLADEIARGEDIMRLPQKQLPPARYRAWREYVVALRRELALQNVPANVSVE